MMIEITEKKAEKLSEHIEESLRHMGKAMQCIDELMEEGGMGERGGSYGNRGGYGNRDANTYTRYGNRYGERGGYGMRDDDDWEDEEMSERRGRRRRDSRGRYM